MNFENINTACIDDASMPWMPFVTFCKNKGITQQDITSFAA